MKINKKSSQNNRTPSNIPSPVQAKLIVTIPSKPNEKTTDPVIKNSAEITKNERLSNDPLETNRISEYHETDYSSIGKEEEIIFVGHGIKPTTIDDYIEEKETNRLSHFMFGDKIIKTKKLLPPAMEHVTPEIMAWHLFTHGLSKDYRGRIYLSSCDTGLRGNEGEESFIERFVRSMKELGYNKLMVRANLGVSASIKKRNGQKGVGIENQKIKAAFKKKSNYESVSKKSNLTSFSQGSHLIGYIDYENGNFIIPGADEDFQHIPGHTNRLNRRFSMGNSENDFINISDNFADKEFPSFEKIETKEGIDDSMYQFEDLEDSEFSDFQTIDSKKANITNIPSYIPKKKGLLSKLKSFW